MSFSRQLLVGTMSLIGGLAAVATIAGAFGMYRAAGAGAERDVFVPVQRVAQVRTLMQMLATSSTASIAAAGSRSPGQAVSFDCSRRQRDALVLRVQAWGSLDQAQEAARRIEMAHEALGGASAVGCAQFFALVEQATRLAPIATAEHVPQAAVERLLTERVSWTHVPPCLFAWIDGARRRLHGPAELCAEDAPQRASSMPREPFRVLGRVAWGGLASAAPERAGRDPAPAFALTIDPRVQAVLDRYARCIDRSRDCDRPDWQHRRAVKAASLVVLDARDSRILGMLCAGAPCHRADLAEFGPAAAGLLQVPPASTAKLLFALGMRVRKGVEPDELVRQLKTSGQLDGSVTKRNEWWERRAICDPDGYAPCDVPAETVRIAQRLGWARNCRESGFACGRVSLLPVGTSLPGFLGVLPAALLGTEGEGEATYLPWPRYDATRRGRLPPPEGRAFTDTSLAIQSVIGAGDARTSALGLATLSANLYQLSRSAAPAPPRLAVPIDRTTWGIVVSSGERRAMSSGLVSAARVVREGMARVMSPAERGWVGDGTGNAAFRSAFGRPCPVRCPVEGKTGTVSASDPVHAGVTLFTALADLTALAQSPGVGPEGVHVFGAGRTTEIAIGVAVFPSSGGSGPHLASHLGTAVLRDLALADVRDVAR